MTRPLSLTALFTVLMISSAAAHTGFGEAAGIAHGLGHPFGGLDHVLAMVAVGLLAASLGGRALFLVPAAFLAAMAIGGFLGAGGIDTPFVEIGIALSVIALGAAIALQWRPVVSAAMAVVGFFAIFHGYAHGVEIPVMSSGAGYAAGFMVATAILHGIGIGIGKFASTHRRPIMRFGGGAMALAGVGMLAGIL
jgi:urease accessory protein